MARPGNASGVQSMFELFQKTMAEGGIVVDLGQDAGDDNTEEIHNEDLEDVSDTEEHSTRLLSRRASFTSMYDALHEDLDVNPDEPPPAYSALALRQKRSSSRATDPGSERSGPNFHRPQLQAQIPTRGRVNDRAISEQLSARSRRSQSRSSQGSIRITRNRSTSRESRGNNAEDTEEWTMHSGESDHSMAPSAAGSHQARVQSYQQSDTQMLADADTFLTHRVRLIARKALTSWYSQMMVRKEREQQLLVVAAAYDRNVLLRSAFRAWFDLWDEKRSVRHTEQYWAQRERLATKLRDEHLVYKAFSHWAQHASDQVMRTSVARRHILRTRYFNAWRDVTAVNQLKVRQHSLHKFFNIWKRRSSQVNTGKDIALASSQDRLLVKALQTWRQRTAEHRLGKEYEILRLQERKKPIFDRWADITRNIVSREASTLQMRHNTLQRSWLVNWVGKAHQLRELNLQAENYRRRSLLTTTFNVLHRAAALRPIGIALSQRTNARVARLALTTIVQRAQQISQAKQFDRGRLMSTSFTAWNDQLRILALSVQIDSRLRLELFHRWRLTERYTRFVKQRDTQVKSKTLSLWFSRCNANQRVRQTAENVLESYHRTSVLRRAIGRIRNRMQVLKDQETQALTVCSPRLKGQFFTKWVDRSVALRQLHLQSDVARFYVLASHAIETWKKATSEHQSARKKEAYRMLRRNYKIGLVRRFFGVWREKSALIQEQHQSAQSKVEDRILRHAQLSIQKWQDASRVLQLQDSYADNHRRIKMLRFGMASIITQYSQNHAMDLRADTFRAEVVHIQQEGCLKRLNWRLFEIQRLQQTGKSLQERNFKKHVRSMLRYWSESTYARQRMRGEQLPTNTSRPDSNFNPQDDEGAFELPGLDPPDPPKDPEEQSPSRRRGNDHSRALHTPGNDWRTALDASAFEIRPLDLDFDIKPDPAVIASPQLRPANVKASASVMATPLPGYLRTPSKRSTARRALDRVGLNNPLTTTTPAGYPPPSQIFPTYMSAPDTITRRPYAHSEYAGQPSTTATVATPRSGISSFETRLKAQGYSAQRSKSKTTGFGAPALTPATAGKGKSKQGRSVGFVGFDTTGDES